jgi:hypothetical protein
MYPVAFAVVEVEVKRQLVMVSKTLLSDLCTLPTEGWTFISDRQKVTLQSFLHLFNFCYATNGFDLMYT